jgi:hypothetical protein
MVPDWVQGNLRFYNTVTRNARWGFYTIESLVVVLSAAIPAAAAMGASVAVTGLLGACVTALIGLRQLTGWRESWVRFAQTRKALEGEVVAWSACIGPYAGNEATPTLLVRTEELIAVETDRWAALRLRDREVTQSVRGAVKGNDDLDQQRSD